jgi:outer membrane protein assembly factor BamB
VAKNGRLAWRHGTGSYVYAAPSVGTVPRFGPTVFIGSYDGNFYALDARSGGVKWAHRDGGRISGAPTVIGDVVYYSSLGHKDTLGLDVRTGKRVWHYKYGAFNPVISDGKRVYLTTSGNLLGLLHREPAKKKKAKPSKPKKGSKKKKK